MSNLFTEYTFGKGNRSAAFNPTSAFPLDARSYFNNLAAAEAAAASAGGVGSTTTTYYYGQQLVVVDNNIATIYAIQPPIGEKTTGWLKEVGATTEIKVDNKSIAFNDNGELEVKDYGDHYYRYNTIVKPEDLEAAATAENVNYWYKETVEEVETYYQCQASEDEVPTYSWVALEVAPASDYFKVNGFKAGLEPKIVSENAELVIAWFEPNPTTVEGLSSQITSLSTTVNNLQVNVGTNADNISKLDKNLTPRVTKLETKVGVKKDEDLGDGNKAENSTGLFADVARIDAKLLVLEGAHSDFNAAIEDLNITLNGKPADEEAGTEAIIGLADIVDANADKLAGIENGTTVLSVIDSKWTEKVAELALNKIELSAGQTLKFIEQKDGKVTAEAQDIVITKSQISDLDESAYKYLGTDGEEIKVTIDEEKKEISATLSETVRTSLGLADSAIQQGQLDGAISNLKKDKNLTLADGLVKLSTENEGEDAVIEIKGAAYSSKLASDELRFEDAEGSVIYSRGYIRVNYPIHSSDVKNQYTLSLPDKVGNKEYTIATTADIEAALSWADLEDIE